jgi:glycosyltransferase involved in cell wall biosynthesis
MPIDMLDETTTIPTKKATRPLRLGIMRDYAEEGWPSMDLCAEMLTRHLRRDFDERLNLLEMRPEFQRRVQRLPWLGRRRFAFNGDRLLNRFFDYPRHVALRRDDADLFHVVDHSYAQVIAGLPGERTGVFCQDLDAFRCILEPANDPRPRWFRSMARRILTQFQGAAVVFHSTLAVREQIERHRLIDPTRLVHAPLGFAEEFRPDPPSDFTAELIRKAIDDRPYLLHVGSCIPRKRIDVLIETFVRLRTKMPELRMVKIGGDWTTAQSDLISGLGAREFMVHAAGIERSTLANLYRSAALVLMPSDAEGFGLPVLEALACGSPVLASDLPVFREVGGEAIDYAPVGDVEAFTAAALAAIQNEHRESAIHRRVAQAERFSWQRHARIIGDAYLRLAR